MEPRPSPVRVTQALLAGAGLVLVVVAALLAFLPLPPNAWGTCGPRFTSASAVSVRLDPGQVVDWEPLHHPALVRLHRECWVDASYRVDTALVVGPLGLLAGAGGPLLVEAVWRRTGRRGGPEVLAAGRAG